MSHPLRSRVPPVALQQSIRSGRSHGRLLTEERASVYRSRRAYPLPCPLACGGGRRGRTGSSPKGQAVGRPFRPASRPQAVAAPCFVLDVGPRSRERTPRRAGVGRRPGRRGRSVQVTRCLWWSERRATTEKGGCGGGWGRGQGRG